MRPFTECQNQNLILQTMKKSAATRLMILQKAFELIYAKGYQTTSIDDIIATTKVTKGAFITISKLKMKWAWR
jgi:hypothetical protein